MNVRELLQIEIWSKETSRRILAPAKKYLVPSKKVVVRVGIALGILMALAGIALAIEMHWLTVGERKAATAALSEIDALQGSVTTGGNDFEANDRRAKQRVAEAERVAWTLRDKGTADLLSVYLYATDSDREMAEREANARAIVKARRGEWHSNPDLDKRSAALSVQTRLMFRSEVLKALH